MGVLEEKLSRRTRKNELRRLILESVKVAGMVGLLVVAPNVIGAMAKLGIIPSRRQREVIERSCERLIRQGFLKRDGSRVCLTKKGETMLQKLSLRDFRFSKPALWDGKWRVVIFDIPEYHKKLRDTLRATLKTIGFVCLQKSVWIFPYDCEDLSSLLKADFRVGEEVLYIVAEGVENDVQLRKYFKLRS